MQRIVSIPLAICVFLLYNILLFRWQRGHPETFRWGEKSPSTELNSNPAVNLEKPDLLQDTQNATLGFERVFAVGFGDRTDKRDAMAMAASFVRMDLDWAGERLDSTPGKHRGRPDRRGSWFAHTNVLQQIVDQKVHSALILEDDADWDITLKAQLLEFARGSRAIQSAKQAQRGRNLRPVLSSPYGDDWDMLWVGPCGITARGEQPFYAIPNDPTVPPVSRRTEYEHPAFADEEGMEQTRFFFASTGGVCTTGYAVTYEGARKILAQLSMMPSNQPVDVAYSALCGSSNDYFRCVASYPPLIGIWLQKGSSDLNSDISDSGSPPHEAYSSGIVYSTRVNAQRLAAGKQTCLAQWEDAKPSEIDSATFTSPRGHLVQMERPETKIKPSHSIASNSADAYFIRQAP
ncbi:hypothetical protein EYZ11_011575 [Aspergillus tanneri]|uniref:LPS glycosyltransferase n=1 Tax=Aspergillus tanneri TaxID=1220188 RepID=A0A4S3J2I4_9EURO|nr:hypothetical protein EYZ11_011575 [Aspergillus tanneri]